MQTTFLFPKILVGVALLSAMTLGAKTMVENRDRVRLAQAEPTEKANTPAGMVYIPAGAFFMGTSEADADDDVKPSRSVFVPAFYMDRLEVTKAQFKKFKPDYSYPAGEDNLPATAVTYDEAEAYAKSLGKHVPTEAEWEKAARGTDGRRYPWGNAWEVSKVAKRGKTLGVKPSPELQKKVSNACRIAPARVQPVGSVAGGISPYGCLDMAGNAWEWVQGHYLNHPDQRILRGGAVGYGERACRTYSHAVEGATSTCNDTGFRCAKTVSAEISH